MNWEYFKKRLKEPTTYIGLVGLVGALGVQIAPEHTDLIVQGGIILGGLVASLLPEKGE